MLVQIQTVHVVGIHCHLGHFFDPEEKQKVKVDENKEGQSNRITHINFDND